ncbi:MAG: DNA polymerase IV [bacterium]
MPMQNQNIHTLFAHVDMDAFFASAEQLDNPKLRGKPVVVGADPKGGRGRGVVSAASYEARKFGIRSAMPVSQAYRRCPTAEYVPVRGERYAEISEKIMEILESFTPFVEKLSIDEAFLDLTGTSRLWGKPLSIGKTIRDKILKQTLLNASVGLAPNKFIAKVCSDYCKPDGLLYISQNEIYDFLGPLKVSRIWGIGPKTMDILKTVGIETVHQLRKTELKLLEQKVGTVLAGHIKKLADGIDPRPIETQREQKSVSNDITLSKDCNDMEFLRLRLLAICDRLASRLRKHGLRGRTVTLKIRSHKFQTRNFSRTLHKSINTSSEISKEILDLFKLNYSGIYLVRLLSAGISNLSSINSGQLDLFPPEKQRQNILEAERAMDKVQDRFGRNALSRGSLLNIKSRKNQLL